MNREQRAALRKEQQDRNLFSRLSAATIASRGQAQRLLKASANLSVTEWRVLWDLSEAGPLSIRDLASIQRTDHSLISRTLPKMSDKGWIKAIKSVEDKRQSLIELTTTGAEAFAAAAPIMKRRRDAFANAFTAQELDTIFRLLDRFEDTLQTPITIEPTREETP